MASVKSKTKQIPSNAGFLLTVVDNGRTYLNVGLEDRFKAAKAAGYKFSKVGDVVNCTTEAALDDLYAYITQKNEMPAYTDVYYTSNSDLFTDLGQTLTWAVDNVVVQVWTLGCLNNDKLAGSGGGAIKTWVPTYCSFHADDLLYDDVHVARTGY